MDHQVRSWILEEPILRATETEDIEKTCSKVIPDHQIERHPERNQSPMASRTTSSTHPRPPSPSSQPQSQSQSSQPHSQPHLQTQPQYQTQTHPANATTATNRRNLLAQSLSRRPPATHTSRARAALNSHSTRTIERTVEPTPSRSGGGMMGVGMTTAAGWGSLQDGTDDTAEGDGERDEEEDDIILSRPGVLVPDGLNGTNGTAPVRYHTYNPSSDLNAQAMAEVMAAMCEDGGGELQEAERTGTNAEEAGLDDRAANGETTQNEKLIEMYRRRERDREQVDQEELKRALWESLRERVRGLEGDRWMFEVEGEVGVEV